jgi:D-3-phosphoglycerate dehydrogenase
MLDEKSNMPPNYRPTKLLSMNSYSQGKYVADFADEALFGHPKVIQIPHLGASTAEAESNSASMAADEVMDFIQTGTIVNSVNFPTVRLPRTAAAKSRLCVVNKNVPGMLGLITSTVGSAGFNIVQQINASRGEIAYNVLDLEEIPKPELVNKVQEDIAKLDGVISSRLIGSAVPGYFLVNETD